MPTPLSGMTIKTKKWVAGVDAAAGAFQPPAYKQLVQAVTDVGQDQTAARRTSLSGECYFLLPPTINLI